MNFYKKIKLSFRGNIPRMDEMDDLDPYKKHKPGDGNGLEMKTPGDEDGWSGFGTRVRGRDFPIDIQEKDDYDLQRERDVPTVNHTLMGEDSPLPDNTGVDNGELYDSDSPLSMERTVADKLEGNFSNPNGPHNMNGGGRLGLYRRLRNRIR